MRTNCLGWSLGPSMEGLLEALPRLARDAAVGVIVPAWWGVAQGPYDVARRRASCAPLSWASTNSARRPQTNAHLTLLPFELILGRTSLERGSTWITGRRLRRPPYAAEMDDALHAERLLGRTKLLHRRNIGELPDGAIAAFDGAAFAIRGDTLLHWTPEGYDARKPRPRHIAIDVFTPPAILEVLSAGYEPRWHPSAKDWHSSSETPSSSTPQCRRL
jgi:hypothetical protein